MKKNIYLDLDKFYFDQNKLSKAVLNEISKQYANCYLVNDYVIKINDTDYKITTSNFNMFVPVQQIILKRMN